MILTILIFFIVIGVLVLVHEFGHFIFAKNAGMRVEEFGFGFPPRIFGIKKGGTLYSVNWIPFGGFVKILGEDGGHISEEGSFGSKKLWPRFKVIVAGVVMNFLLAAFLLMIVNFFGLRIGLINNNDIDKAQNKAVQILEISQGSPAQKAGLELLDEIKGFKLSGVTQNVNTTEDVQNFILSNTGRPVTIIISRGGQILEKDVTPRANPPTGQGALGISLALTGIVHYPWYESIWRGVYDAVILTINTAIGYWLLIKTLVIHGKLIGDISGPIGIANLTGQAARIGFNYLLQFVAMISINLVILNIIPFPALDGGRVFLLFIEKIKGSPLNKKFENLINSIGFALLIALMVYVTIKDIIRFI